MVVINPRFTLNAVEHAIRHESTSFAFTEELI